MRLSDLIEHQTTDGKEISFRRIPSSEGDRNRGWIVDKLIAFIDGEEVGYLKMSYIPTERFNKYYPCIFNYISQIEGHVTIDLEENGVQKHYKDLNDEKIRKLLKALYNRSFVVRSRESELTDIMSKIDVADRFDLIQFLQRIEKQLLATHHGEKFKLFKTYQVDRPIVDYINVEKSVRRNRIGFALYIEGAKWMKEKGLQLFASSLQSDLAIAAWKKFEELGMVGVKNMGNKKTRKFLKNFEHID